MRLVLCLAIITFFGLCIGKTFSDGADELDDFPLDSEDENLQIPNGTTTNISTEDADNKIDRIDPGKLLTSERRAEILHRIMVSVMKKPGAKQRMAEALPIIRTMSPTQKLALASMIMSQLTAKPNQHSSLQLQLADNSTAELMLPISMDIASMFSGINSGPIESARSTGFGLPYHNPVLGGYRPGSNQYAMMHNTRRIQNLNSRRRDQVPPEMMPPPPSNDSYAEYNTRMPPKSMITDLHSYEEITGNPSTYEQAKDVECSLMTNDVCLEMPSYPDIEILESISNVDYNHMFRALTDDAVQTMKSDPVTIDQPEIDRRYSSGNKVLEEGIKLCQSKIKYARPKKAKSMSGHWKYVVNTGEYTQTIRMESCLNIDKPCSHVAGNVNSQCVQIYNYHRLLTWDEVTGLSLDIFKIPTCCSCQVQNALFPISKGSPKQDNYVQDNGVSEESDLQAPPLKQPKIRIHHNLQHNAPKRELVQKLKKIANQTPTHQDINESRHHMKYTSIDSASRRNSAQKNSQRINVKDEYSTESETMFNNGIENESLQSKVNYNYHPIIDFFKTSSATHNSNERMDVQGDESNHWLPITSGPRVIPK